MSKEEIIQAWENEIIQEWKEQVYDKGKEVIDPECKYHWESLAYGFFLGKGVGPERAKELAWKYHYIED